MAGTVEIKHLLYIIVLGVLKFFFSLRKKRKKEKKFINHYIKKIR